MARSKELYLRWLELGAFSPVMRSHEGNQPEANWQFDSDAETVDATARFSRIHAALKPYLKAAGRESSERGIPMMRPLLFYYSSDFGYDGDHAYFLGCDLDVYPVCKPGAVERRLVLPDDERIDFGTERSVVEAGALSPRPSGPSPYFNAQRRRGGPCSRPLPEMKRKKGP